VTDGFRRATECDLMASFPKKHENDIKKSYMFLIITSIMEWKGNVKAVGEELFDFNRFFHSSLF
jgi:hypothetical protein